MHHSCMVLAIVGYLTSLVVHKVMWWCHWATGEKMSIEFNT